MGRKKQTLKKVEELLPKMRGMMKSLYKKEKEGRNRTKTKKTKEELINTMKNKDMSKYYEPDAGEYVKKWTIDLITEVFDNPSTESGPRGPRGGPGSGPRGGPGSGGPPSKGLGCAIL